MRTTNATACEKGTDLTATTLIEVRSIDRRNRKLGRIERSVTAGRQPSVPVSELCGHFFTAK